MPMRAADLRCEPTIKVVVPPPRDGDKPKNDANLILQKEGAEALATMVTTAEPAVIPISALAERYARLSPEQRANRRGDMKDARQGRWRHDDRLRSSSGELAARRGEAAGEDGLAGLIRTVKPVDEYVPTAELFDMILKKLRQHVFAEDWQLDLMSIWIMGTYVHPYLSTYPFLLFTAPTREARVRRPR